MEDSESEKGTWVVQRALLLVFERMFEGKSEMDGGDDEECNKSSSAAVVRLFVLSFLVKRVAFFGKGGSVIKQMSSESGAEIRSLPRDKLPSCASSSDELVQVIF